MLAVAGGDGSLTLWDVRKLDPKAEVVASVRHSKTCLSAYFAPDGASSRSWIAVRGLSCNTMCRHHVKTLLPL